MTGGEVFLAAPRGSREGNGTCLLLAPPDPAEPEPAGHSSALGLGAEGAARRELLGEPSTGLQSSALKRKEREAPQDSPRARKKVMRAPATSLSCGSTCLGARHMVRDTR